MSDRNPQPQTAVWYFVAATFIFAAPTLFFRDAGIPWLLPISMAVGFGVFACGIVILVSEINQSRKARGIAGGEALAPPSAGGQATGAPAGTAPGTTVGTPMLSLAAAFTALLAVAGCVVAVAVHLPLFVELAIILVSVVLLAGAGAMIGIVVTRGRPANP